MGTPPTPMPTFMCTGMRAAAMQGLTYVRARAEFQAADSTVEVFTAGPNTVAPACCTTAS